ncbi:MAG: ribonuclease D [Anaerolineales bacterium]|nr:ribonuclease D [Anaerolineales bacterium]
MAEQTPALITHPAELRRLVDALHQETILAVDTESNSLFAYREQVCLIQFSTLQADYLVDPLALKDLSPLAALFASPKIEKVFHAAEYDLICLHRDFGFEFTNLFDTMVAARILGWEALGLGSILESQFGLSMDKRYQRANWGQRPLPPDLLEYARHDTQHLIPLRQRLYLELQQRDLWELAAEDFARLSSLKALGDNGRLPAEDKTPDCWRISGAYDLQPQQAAVLLELCRYRDQVARSHNRPLFKVIGDHTLLSIAAHLPEDQAALSQLPGMSSGQLRRHGAQLLQAVQRGLQAEPLFPPRSTRPSEAFLRRMDALRRWRKAAAEQMGVASDVVLPRDMLITLAEQAPRSMEELTDLLTDTPWRLEHFGPQILTTLTARKTT